MHSLPPVDILIARDRSRAMPQSHTVPDSVKLSYGHNRANVLLQYVKILVEFIVNTYLKHLNSLQ